MLLWVAGFDLIYATMDYDFDRAAGLRSLVVRYGIPTACGWRKGCTRGDVRAVVRVRLVGGPGRRLPAGWCWCSARLSTNTAASPVPRRWTSGAVNRAFFNANAFVGAVFVLAVWAAVW